MRHPINRAALVDIMQLARRNATASATATASNNTSDDDIISPRIREFFERLEEANIRIVEVELNEEDTRITFQSNSDEYDNLLLFAYFVNDDIRYSFTTGDGYINDLCEAIMSSADNLRYKAQAANILKKNIDNAFELIRDRTQEHDRTNEYER